MSDANPNTADAASTQNPNWRTRTFTNNTYVDNRKNNYADNKKNRRDNEAAPRSGGRLQDGRFKEPHGNRNYNKRPTGNAKKQQFDSQDEIKSLNKGVESITIDDWTETQVDEEMVPDKTSDGSDFTVLENEGGKKKRDNVSKQNYDRVQKDELGKLFDLYDAKYRNAHLDFKHVEEISCDLFAMDKDYCLAHCVAEDLNMGSGIAVSFRQEFKQIGELLQQREKQGGCAVLKNDHRYIYYLITKRESTGKPTYNSMFNSVHKMKLHMVENGMTKLAAPRIGCGLDRLEWDEVKNMLEMIFEDTDIKITICNFQQAEEVMSQKKDNLKHRKCNLVLDPRPVIQLEQYTIILYIGTEDKHVSEELKMIDEKFNVVVEYKKEKKSVGEYICTNKQAGSYLLYGCIVKPRANDDFNYKAFADIISNINKENNKRAKKFEKYEYVAIQYFYDNTDSLVMAKVINLLRNTFFGTDVYVCESPKGKF